MRVQLKLFAAAKQLVGSHSIELELAAGATIGDLRTALLSEYPATSEILDHCLFAIDNEYADSDTVISHQETVACIPPVSGG